MKSLFTCYLKAAFMHCREDRVLIKNLWVKIVVCSISSVNFPKRQVFFLILFISMCIVLNLQRVIYCTLFCCYLNFIELEQVMQIKYFKRN